MHAYSQYHCFSASVQKAKQLLVKAWRQALLHFHTIYYSPLLYDCIHLRGIIDRFLTFNLKHIRIFTLLLFTVTI